MAPAELEAQKIATERLMGHDPELSPREEAIFLLHTAAEVEHALRKIISARHDPEAAS